MSFKGKKTLVLGAVLLMTACSWWGDKVEQTDSISIDAGDVLRFGDINCIKNIGPFFADYFYGRSSTYEIDDMKNCIESTMDSVFDLAYKDDEEGFNRSRMRNILESVIGGDSAYDLVEMSNLIFELKRFFIGGGRNTFYKEEWQAFKPSLDKLALALDHSKEAAKIIFFSGRDQNLTQREVLYKKLGESFKMFDAVKNSYSKTHKIEEVESLVSVLLNVISLDKFTPVALSGRKIIYPTENIYSLEQDKFLVTVWDVFQIQSRLRELDFSEGLMIGESNADLIKSVQILTSRLKTWSFDHPKEFKFSTTTIKEVLNNFFTLGLMKDSISDPQAINDTVDNMFTRIFGGSVLTSEDFSLLHKVFENWANYYPTLIKDLDVDWARRVYSSLSVETKDLSLRRTTDQLLEDFTEPKFVSGPNEPIHILFDKERVLNPTQIYFDKALKHIFLVLSEPVTVAYNPEINEDRIGASVVFDENGLDRLLVDFRPLGLELGVINRYSCDSSFRIYLESNLFTQNADGDEFISLIEAAEWLGTMIATSSLTNHVFANVDRDCAFEGEEIYSYPFYKRTCFQDSMFNNKNNLETFFPGLADYLSVLRSQSRRENFQENLDGWLNYANSYYEFNELDDEFFETVFMNQMNACLQVKDDEEYLNFPLSRSEFNATIATLSYVENFFSKYDNTGISGLIGPDPADADLIIDGQELSVFINEKVHREDYQNLIVDGIRQNWWARRFGSEARWKKRIKNLPEWAALLDRQRVTDLIHSVLSDTLVVDPLEENFCNQIMDSSLRGPVITFDTEAALQCPAID